MLAVLTNLNTINWYTALISAISLFILFLPKCCLKGKIPKWVPIPLIIIVFWILVSYFADLESVGVAIVGADIKSGFPMPKAPDFSYMSNILPAAIVVAIVPYMGSIALAKGFEQKTKETYKQQLSTYNQWCRDNVATMDNDTPLNQNNHKTNGHDTNETKTQTQNGASHDPKASDKSITNSKNCNAADILSTPKRSHPTQSSEDIKVTSVKLKDEGQQNTQTSTTPNIDTIQTASNGSFSPTLSEKNAAALPLVAIDRYSMQC